MKKSILVALVFLISIGCASAVQKKKKKSQAKNGNKIESVLIDNSACFGRCPSYDIQVKKNGTVRYTGLLFVKDSGTYEKNIGTAAAMKLFTEFNTYKVDTCQNEYPNKIPDLSGITYTIVYTDKTKKIRNAHFGPEFLKQLSADMDKLAKVDTSWKKITTTK